MSKRISEFSKFKKGRGMRKHPGGYHAWHKSREINSPGTTSSEYDYKKDRMVQCLSYGEIYTFHMLRWRDDVDEIYEQYPLTPIQETMEIAAELGYKGSFNDNIVMTTDFLVKKTDGTFLAVSVKVSEKAVTKREKQLLDVEREYWKRRGIEYFMSYKDEIDMVEVNNIMRVVASYSPKSVHDDPSLARYLIAHKLITVDLKKEIDINKVIETYKETEIWQTKSSQLLR